MTRLDRQMLDRAILLAMNGRGKVEPNPMVGCVIAKADRVIGEGFHEQFGGPHAEPRALAACTESPAGATAFVTLEPCCHANKKTPPCVPALISAGIGRVVVGCIDSNPNVSGRGLAELRAAGVDAIDAEDAHCKQLLAPFIATTVYRRPYVTLKWAQSADGKVAGPGGKTVQISNSASRRLVHQLRSRCDAILVGIGTVLNDDPLLTARGTDETRPLIRAVLDSDLRLPLRSRLAQTLDLGPVIVFCSKEAAEYSGTRVPLAAIGIQVVPVSLESPGRLNLSDVLGHLGSMQVTHLLVEPGPNLAKSFINASLHDRAWIFHSPKRIDSGNAPSAPSLHDPVAGEMDVHGDTLKELLNPASPAYFSPDASADFVLGQES